MQDVQKASLKTIIAYPTRLPFTLPRPQSKKKRVQKKWLKKQMLAWDKKQNPLLNVPFIMSVPDALNVNNIRTQGPPRLIPAIQTLIVPPSVVSQGLREMHDELDRHCGIPSPRLAS